MKTKVKTKPFNGADYLKTPEDIYYLLNEVLQAGDSRLIARALGDVARSKGMTAIAKKTGLSRTNLHHSLNENGNPQLDTVSRLIKSFGFTLVAMPSENYDPERFLQFTKPLNSHSTNIA